MNTLLNFQTVKDVTRGTWITPPSHPEKILRGGAFDTRNLNNAQIFFAWKGESSDGHNYIHQLATSEIELIIVEKEVSPVGDKPILKVTDSLQALHQLAKKLMEGFEGTVVNLTGSSGKTTTKGWLRHIINGHRNLLTNEGSFNNHIGCPITILNLKEEHDLIILEMGTSGSGEIEKLASIAPADIALLLNVGHAHLGMFGSMENIYKAKLELFNHLKKDSVNLLPAFDILLRDARVQGEKILFGKGSEDFSWSFEGIDLKEKSQMLKFKTPYGEKSVTIPKLGNYVGNLISAVIAVCYYLKLSWEQIECGLSNLPQEKGRATFKYGLNDVLIFDDTYNANPESVIAMLETIASLQMERTVAVVGNLAELDENLTESAGYIIERIPSNLTDLILSGDSGKILYPQIRDAFPHLNLKLADSISDIYSEVRGMTDSKTVIGVKGSRSSHMERVVAALQGKESNCPLIRCGKLMMCNQCDEF